MEVTRAFKYHVDPPDALVPLMCSNLGGGRFAYNHLLGLVKANWAQVKAEKETPEGQVTDYQRTDRISLMYLWHATKDGVAADWRMINSSEVYNDAAGRLAKAFSKFRKGTGKFPVFKKKEWAGSVKFAKGAVKILDRHHVNLSKVGSLKTYESMRKMCRHLERGTATLISATLKRESGGWFVVFTVKMMVPDPAERTGGRVVGVDVGLKTLLVGATQEGEQVLGIANPRPYQRSRRKLAHAQKIASRRQGPSSGQPGSKRYVRAQARVRKVHARVSNQREALAQEVSSQLVKDYDIIVVEDLAIKNLVKNHTLAKAIHDAGWGNFLRMLEYKASWAGVQVVKAPRFYPSSKTCSACGHVKAKLSLAEREYECTECGMVLDRDLNAATNIARLGVTSPAGTHSVAGRGGNGKTKAGSSAAAQACEASTLSHV